ncbi:D-serine deaminase-like pyridoxal phosphate-dependent protein [Kribbella amoyensis]|uniref:D-serine deaminase-like pyridoxal phosphate-dependent protein n=1 Tax=Kribbella amoyensis TaxID=996641 RepID=A0A561BKY1_9ACTN|nr:amino acid deaminase [Kribbella amoyensis]TWD79536.1 D-serine deaminase-like pyridoxal phosphate-dependent protein [Kribbella amoyensis]
MSAAESANGSATEPGITSAAARTTYDAAAVAALAEQSVSWQDKAVPPAWWGRRITDILAEKPRLSALPTPLLTLSATGMRHNLTTMAGWCAEHGVELAPHGKTTMAPALWAAQLDAGCWAITLANGFQLGVARAYGVARVIVANEVISPLQLRWIADELAADPAFEVFVWADSVRTVELMEAARSAYVGPDARPLDVLVEVGGANGRTGVRDTGTGVAVAKAIADSSTLRLAGVAGYEGAIARGADEAGLEHVRAYLRDLAAIHLRAQEDGLYDEGVVPVVSAGGSAYFEQVAKVLAPLGETGARVVLRSGAYIAHDDGYYREISPLGSHPRTDGDRLVPAMHGWVRITSQPEPGLAIFDAGKRDLPFDEGLPEPQLLRPRSPGEAPARLDGMTVVKVNDQHGFLRFDEAGPAPLVIGDELRVGLSHPCTAFDKWGLIPVVDDPDAEDPVVVDLVRTFF